MTEIFTQIIVLLPALLEGALLGGFFFGGLWWTVRKLESAKQVALLFLGSMLLRTSTVLFGFYFIMDDDWQRLFAGLFGFILARIIVIKLTCINHQAKRSSKTIATEGES